MKGYTVKHPLITMEVITLTSEKIELHKEGTWENPLFRASEVGKVLGIINIHNAIHDFDETEKITKMAMTAGGMQNVAFLTAQGLYLVTMKSRKPFAVEFRKWVCKVIEEIRLKGKYELEDKYKALLHEKDAANNRVQERVQELENEVNQLMTCNANAPVIYIFNKDTRDEIPELKIGISEKVRDRIKPYKQTHPFGKLEYTVAISDTNLRTAEHWLHTLLADYRVGTKEVFKMTVEDALLWVTFVRTSLQMSLIRDANEKKEKLLSIVNYSRDVVDGIKDKVCVSTVGCQTDPCDDIPPEDNKDDENIAKFEQFINECCFVKSDAQVSSSDIQGAFRLWAKKAEKEAFHGLNDYLKTKFKPCRLKVQNTQRVENGFTGVCLKQSETPIVLSPSPPDVELFLYQNCQVVPRGKSLISTLLKEYIQWKRRVGKYVKSDKEETDDINTYLKDKPYALKAVLWNIHGNGTGYYGIHLKSDDMYKCTNTSSTAKKVCKYDQDGNLLDSWSTIAKAAQHEGICQAKMSRIIKNKTEYNGCTFTTS